MNLSPDKKGYWEKMREKHVEREREREIKEESV